MMPMFLFAMRFEFSILNLIRCLRYSAAGI
jgi:hypothetical protein